VSAPILTLEQAAAWLNANGVTIDLEISREAAHWPYKWDLKEAGDAGQIAFVEAVRQVADRDDAPVDRITPCPDSELDATCRSLIAGMRTVAEQLNTLRRGAREVQKHEIARRLFNMGSDLVTLAGMVLS
jgi:hypothetical protein